MTRESQMLGFLREENLDSEFEGGDGEALRRADRLIEYSPVYRSLLRRFPEYFRWLEKPRNRDESFGYTALQSVWEEQYDGGTSNEEEVFRALRRFRRQMFLRIAYRDINHLGSFEESLKELTLLAEFCLSVALGAVARKWEKNLGVPQDEESGGRAGFCILGLGKLGGEELNFCSDLDLIYFFSGDGVCVRGGRTTAISTKEFFARLCTDLTARLQERDEEGFLYNVDLRLRPEGQSGPIVRSLASMESYYFSAGQTWERLALMRARPVAGDRALGEEFFEILNPFRYPRNPPPSVSEEVAGMKLRTEKEVVGIGNLEQDIKSGYGGIREIEFYVQGLQLLNVGKNPFLQCHGTMEAIERLERYELIDRRSSESLLRLYLFLRQIEHRLQMREERSTHSLPEPGPERDALARSLGFSDTAEFEKRLNDQRDSIRQRYLELFRMDSREEEIQEWIHFVSGGEPSFEIRERIEAWLGEGAEENESRLRNLILGAPHNLLTREHLLSFLDISRQFEKVLKPLAQPIRTLERISRFSENYGSRKQFFNTCGQHPQFLQALCLLFDRSDFIYQLLSRHPEILEEIFLTGLLRSKDEARIEKEIAQLPQGDEFSKWLWLYVRAEQVRLAISELLGVTDQWELESGLTDLADAVLRCTQRRVDPESRFAIVALGKLGGRELTLGSDLDLILFSDPGSGVSGGEGKARLLLRVLGSNPFSGPLFEVDLRLRPFGNDGPLVTSLSAFAKYHASSAQTWERQCLTRARAVTGSERFRRSFEDLREELVFEQSLYGKEFSEIRAMRHRIEEEKAKVTPLERAFKTGPGGLLDFEFLAQTLQMAKGGKVSELRTTRTREVLEAAAARELFDEIGGRRLIENYDFLRRIELYLRRASNSPVTEIQFDEKQEHPVGKWLGFESFATFWDEHAGRMKENRMGFENWFESVIGASR